MINSFKTALIVKTDRNSKLHWTLYQFYCNFFFRRGGVVYWCFYGASFGFYSPAVYGITSENHAAKLSLYSARFASPLSDIHLPFFFVFWAELKRKGDRFSSTASNNRAVTIQKSKAQPLSSKTRLRPLDSLDLRESFVNQISLNWSQPPRYNLNQLLSFLCC